MIRRTIGEVLARGLHDDRVRGIVSVTRVAVAADLTAATIHVSVLPAAHARLVLRGLRHAAPRIRAELARRVQMRRIPRLSFELDESLKRQADLDAALADAREQGSAGPEPQPEPGP